jgi:hypothetical protein
MVAATSASPFSIVRPPVRQRSKVSAIVWPVDSLPNKRIPPAKSVIGCNAR